MLEQLLNHINRSSLCKTTDKILVAVSGGLDSMVMLHLLKSAGFTVGVAHCNFRLRGPESDADEQFVRDTCRQLDIPFHTRHFDTNSFALERAVSIQMAARDLRYDFFQQIITNFGYDYVATAHHWDDVIESVFLNLLRGTGIDGIRGIAVKKQNIIRPMMFATRDMIHAYALASGIRWRDDASNDTDDYRRNFLRHQVIPRLKELNPSFVEGFRDTHDRLLGTRAFARAFIDEVRQTALESRSNDSLHIGIAAIRKAPFPPVLLWELIKHLGFKYDQCKRITADHQPGKTFLSETHQLVVDRSQYIIEARRQKGFVTEMIQKGQRRVGTPPHCLSLLETSAHDFELQKDACIAQLDAGLLKYPLTWRRWKAGDYFVPLGMRVEKKVSDLLIDLKIPFNAKADVTVLESAGEIVWIVGHRISDRYKVTPTTGSVLIVKNSCGPE